MTFNWSPNRVPTGELEKFVVAYRLGTSRADGGKCEEEEFRDLIGKESRKNSRGQEFQSLIIDDEILLKNILESIRLKCKKADIKFGEYKNTRLPKRALGCSGDSLSISDVGPPEIEAFEDDPNFCLAFENQCSEITLESEISVSPGWFRNSQILFTRTVTGSSRKLKVKWKTPYLEIYIQLG